MEARTLFLWRFANIEFDERSFELRIGGVPVDVERAPLRLLRALLEAPGAYIARDELLEQVWRRKPDTISRTALSNAVGKLRRALGDEVQHLIAGAPAGGGYALTAAVQRSPLTPLQSLATALKAGQAAPHRPDWILQMRIDATDISEVWRAQHRQRGEQRIFKYAGDGFQVAALRREVTIARLMFEALGARPDFVRIHDWNLERPPYFIESDFGGLDLGRWVDARGGFEKIPLTERLQLVIDLAEAIAAAHSIGVLHKDLKPRNVLIDDTGGDGWRLRVVDFGSGRLLDPEILEQYQITHIVLPESDVNSGTPFYIAPELLIGQPPTIASDIYAIGVLLYQLVIGDLQRPIAPGWEQDIDDALLREDIAAAAEGNPKKRLTEAKALASRLKQLDARRQARLEAQSAVAQAQALQKKLERQQLVRRGLVTTVIVLALGLASAGILSLKLLQSQQRAEREAQTSAQISDYLVSLFDAASPDQTGGKPIEPQKLIDRGQQQIDKELQHQPVLKARMLGTVGTLYCKLELADDCRKDIEQALTIERSDPSTDPLTIAQLLHQQAKAAASQQRWDDDERSLRQELAILQQRLKPADPLIAKALHALGVALESEQKTTESIAVLERARTLMRGPDGEDTVDSIDTLGALADSYQEGGRLDEAIKLSQHQLQLVRAHFGSGDLKYLNALSDYGSLMWSGGQNQEAEKAHREALLGFERIYAPDSNVVIDTMGNLAGDLNSEGRVKEAVDLMTQVVRVQRVHAQTSNPLYAISLNNLAEVLESYGDYPAALPDMRESLDIARKHYGDGNLIAVIARFNLGRLLALSGQAAEALPLLKPKVPAALEGEQAQYERGRRLRLLGDCYRELRQFALANENYDASEVLLKSIGQVAAAQTIIYARARMLIMEQRYADALPLLRDTLQRYSKDEAADAPDILGDEVSLAHALAGVGQIAQAQELINKVAPVVDRELAPMSRTRIELAQLEHQLKIQQKSLLT